MAIRNTLGNIVDTVGTSLGLPEMQISERIAGGWTNNSTRPMGQETIQNYPGVQPAYSGGEVQGPVYSPQPNTSLTQLNTAPSNTNTGTTTNTTTNPFDVQNPAVSPDEVSSMYNQTFDVLNQAESNLRGQLPGLISEAEQQANLARQQLSQGREAQANLLGQQKQRVSQTGQRQTADQRRLFQELTQANQQRFGGASSAGQAASELQGREFQRSVSGIQQNVQQGLQEIGNQLAQVENEYQMGLQQIQVNTQQAINDINRRFQDKLLEINQQRAATEEAKQQARLSALQEYRNQAYQINVAKAQFEADLQRQAQANASYLTQAQQQLMQYGQQGMQAGDQMAGTTPTAIPAVEESRQAGNAQSLTGLMRPEDEFLGRMDPNYWRNYTNNLPR